MKKTVLFSALIALGLVAQTAQAGVSVRAGSGSSTYKLSGDYGPGQSTYAPVTVGVTFSGDSGLYLDIASTAGKGTHDTWTAGSFPKEDFKRSDASLIIGSSGMNPDTGNISNIYFGLKSGKTDLGARPALAPYLTTNYGYSWTNETFTSSGFVFGGGIAFPIAQGDGGVFGLNGGLGLMGATWEDTSGYSAKADSAVGVSFGLSYSYQLQSWLGLTVDYKGQSYAYKFGPNFTVNESISALGATLTLRF